MQNILTHIMLINLISSISKKILKTSLELYKWQFDIISRNLLIIVRKHSASIYQVSVTLAPHTNNLGTCEASRFDSISNRTSDSGFNS